MKKNIPEQGGLGWGSSNFASFVKMYFQTFDLWDVPQELIQRSRDIGKDIPFLFEESPCMMWSNFWERLSLPKFPKSLFSGKELWIYKPNFWHNTQEAYQSLENFETKYTHRFIQHPEIRNCNNAFNKLLKQKKYGQILENEDMEHVNLCWSGSCFFSFEKIATKNCKEIPTSLL